MSRRPRTILGAFGAVATTLAFGCAPGLANLHADLRAEVARARRMFELCQDMGQADRNPSARSRPFLGTDGKAIDRTLISLTGRKAPFDPLDDVNNQLREAQRIARETPMRGGDPDILRDTTRAIEVITRIRGHWDRADGILSDLLKNQKFVIEELNKCANLDLKHAKTAGRETCKVNGVNVLFQLAKEKKTDVDEVSNKIQADLDALTRVTRALLVDVIRLRERADRAATGPIPLGPQGGGPGSGGAAVIPEAADLLEQTNFAIRELTALGGLLRDGASAMARLGTINDDKTAEEAIGRVLLDAEADRVADWLVLSLERAVARVDKAIEKLDEQTYGAASSLVSLGLESGAVEEAVCAVGKEAKVALHEAGLHPGSLGARVCKAAVGNARDFAPSPILARVYEGLIGAASELSCANVLHNESKDKDIAAARSDGYRREPKACWPLSCPLESRTAPDGARTPEQIAGALESLARATWKGRVQVAESALTRVVRPYQYGEHTMPRLRDIPPRLGATLLLIEVREGDLLKRYNADPFRQFFLAQELVLATAWASESGIYDVVCGDQIRVTGTSAHRLTLLPLGCSNLREGGSPPPPDTTGIEDAIRQVAWELCSSNAKIDQKAEVEEFCAMVSDGRDLEASPKGKDSGSLSPVFCIPAGYGAVVTSPTFDLCPLQFVVPGTASSSDLACKGHSHQPVNAAQNNLDKARLSTSMATRRIYQSIATSQNEHYVRFIGRASQQTVSSSAKFIRYAIEAQDSVGCAKTPRLQKLTDGLRGIGTSNSTNGAHTDMNYIFEWPKNHPTSAERITIFSYSTGRHTLRPLCWLFDFLDHDDVLSRYRSQIDAALTLSASSKTTEANEALSELANEILSIFRAVGAAQLAMDTVPDLCEKETCIAEAIGQAISKPYPSPGSRETQNKEHATWRSTSIIVSRKAEVPSCAHLQHPLGIRQGPPPAGSAR